MQSEDQKIIDVSMSEMRVATNDHILRSSGIGSCVVVTLYDPIGRVGAMAHPMLPISDFRFQISDLNQKSKIKNYKSESLRFIEPAIDAMIAELAELGAVKSRLESKLVGGASMFEVFDKNPNSIGTQNVEAAKKKLEKESIKIVATDTGENCGRSVAFDLTTGVVEVKTKI